MPKFRITREACETIYYGMEFVVALFVGLGLPIMLCVIAATYGV